MCNAPKCGQRGYLYSTPIQAHTGPSPFMAVTSHSLSLQEKKKTWWHFTIIKNCLM